MGTKFIISDFEMSFFIEINFVILLNTALYSNAIALFTANLIGE